MKFPPKDNKKVAAQEIKFMKKGGAPKGLIAHEKQEHKTMKFASGGKVATRAATKKMGKAC